MPRNLPLVGQPVMGFLSLSAVAPLSKPWARPLALLYKISKRVMLTNDYDSICWKENKKREKKRGRGGPLESRRYSARAAAPSGGARGGAPPHPKKKM